MNTTIENDILKAAFYQFSRLTGGKVKEQTSQHQAVDTEREILLGKEKHVFWVEVKHELRQSALPALLTVSGKQKDRWLIVAKYIPQPIKAQLKEQGINYLEVSGNCYINTGGLFVYINDRPVTPARRTAAGKLWKPAGLKFLFAILSEPGLLQSSYRQMATVADIALGSIGPLLEELEGQHLIKREHTQSLLNKEMLVGRWTELYPVVMKPGLLRGRFRFLNPSIRQKWRAIQPDHFLWGGEPAGELYTNFLEPELFTIYTDKEPTTIMKELQLVPDPDGEVQLIKLFWNKAIFNKSKEVRNVVPPLVAYADLMDTPNSRNWEVATRIKKKYLHD